MSELIDNQAVDVAPDFKELEDLYDEVRENYLRYELKMTAEN